MADGSMQDVDDYTESEWRAKFIEFTVDDRVARITLNRPPANLLSIDVMNDVARAIDAIEYDTDTKLVVIAAKGKFFSAGFELTDHLGDRGYVMVESFRRIFEGLIKIDKPSLAVVAGPALGAGSLLAAGCDMTLAASSAKFGHPEIRAGVFNTVAMAVLPRLVGRKRAFELVLSGASIPAAAAERIGLVNRAVPDDELQSEAEALIRRCRKASGMALQSIRRAMVEGYDRAFPEAVERAEDVYLNQLMLSEDAEEGLQAVMEKREPVWKNK